MAFMMPVVKNDWDIYKSNRSRRSSECSNPQSCRSRKVSECSKSEGPSLSTSPGSDFLVGSPAHRSVPVQPAVLARVVAGLAVQPSEPEQVDVVVAAQDGLAVVAQQVPLAAGGPPQALPAQQGPRGRRGCGGGRRRGRARDLLRGTARRDGVQQPRGGAAAAGVAARGDPVAPTGGAGGQLVPGPAAAELVVALVRGRGPAQEEERVDAAAAARRRGATAAGQPQHLTRRRAAPTYRFPLRGRSTARPAMCRAGELLFRVSSVLLSLVGASRWLSC
ncbi:Uncharacterized protein GBIM_19389 [Gryllus bimaculatus]|nr:Uncharacterized protein GBIM_19389 [Gryllus bimaculatus]